MKYEDIARQIATEAHKNQFRHDNVTPYITHCEAVASIFKDDEYKAVALLHDVLEDTNVSCNDILKLGISNKILANVLILTKPNNITYLEYIEQLKSYPIARAVKLQDIAHNYPTSKESARERYDKALKILKA